jgi:hypothetical protein
MIERSRSDGVALGREGAPTGGRPECEPGAVSVARAEVSGWASRCDHLRWTGRLVHHGSLLALADGAPTEVARSVQVLLPNRVSGDAAVVEEPAQPSTLVHEATR